MHRPVGVDRVRIGTQIEQFDSFLLVVCSQTLIVCFDAATVRQKQGAAHLTIGATQQPLSKSR